MEYLSIGLRRVDYIARTETLTDDLRPSPPVRAHLDAATSGERVRPGGASYRDRYTPVTRDWVAELFARDIEAFGYDFEEPAV